MKLSLSFSVLFAILLSSLFFCCKKNSSENDTILKGGITVIVDETLEPIIADQVEVFESEYNADITVNSKSEMEASLALVKDTSRIIVLSRELNESEIKYFEKLKIKPKTTKIGTDAIAFISNKKNNDTLISLQEVIDFMRGKSTDKIKGLVFDNPNSSTVRYMNELASLKVTPEKGIYSFKTNEEVVEFVSNNEGMVGIVGLNWLYQPTATIESYLKNVNVLSVKGVGKNDYFAPTQNNIAEGTYPLARDLFIINCQGYSGLGMGFASFIAGDVGQRIMLKAGLLPVRVPSRKLLIK
ncbi:PstS family phosphate ABC transporter substrate-binding protein [Flavobacterium algicola]|uniref:PstS family phosphate ABC transporter substrate-binding protein n=1 Tax=Flavobacterium algicola TaxID=556529 RepID=UPI001EFDBE2E|nr:substrate-binding domain-containing protein [Flavobacterium algicola]MCG9794213.1 substrate-binding domain-containing protein [Flavobacterium algicola]